MQGFERIKEAGGIFCIGRQESIVPWPLWLEIESTTSLDLYWLCGLHPICTVTSTSSAVWCLLQGTGSTKKDSTTLIDQVPKVPWYLDLIGILNKSGMVSLLRLHGHVTLSWYTKQLYSMVPGLRVQRTSNQFSV
eukprot:3831817-Rhodomonas_salina.1